MIDASEIIIYKDDPVDWPDMTEVCEARKRGILTGILRWLEVSPDRGWRFYEVPFWRRSPILGQRIIMRNKINGRWQYRAMTRDEADDLASTLAW